MKLLTENALSGAQQAQFEGALHRNFTIFQAMLGGRQNLFQKGSLKRLVNQDCKSGNDIVPYMSDSAGDGAHKA